MKHRFEKSMKIMNSLMAYCYSVGGSEFHMDMKLREDTSIYYIASPAPKLNDSKLKDLIEILNVHRQHEVEQEYWLLGGDSEDDLELELVGMMIDGVNIDFKDGLLSIIAKRYEI